ncbi:hypothetical protein HY572_01505 [Candidatus Micrarchaeota archaeon]|nr:hypothetical protein [Candidatus Micrarchaeota archaeon]
MLSEFLRELRKIETPGNAEVFHGNTASLFDTKGDDDRVVNWTFQGRLGSGGRFVAHFACQAHARNPQVHVQLTLHPFEWNSTSWILGSHVQPKSHYTERKLVAKPGVAGVFGDTLSTKHAVVPLSPEDYRQLRLFLKDFFGSVKHFPVGGHEALSAPKREAWQASEQFARTQVLTWLKSYASSD